ncbi:MAG: 5'/3'-nucleotidase SurE [Candidatus Omnitrophica bacterium]|nr:5'/3'-nucleotidase SurE [Candidatus Omnitrophota bacterium]
MNILLTNDDGIHAPGLRALLAGMPSDVRTFVVAPASERSACSHSISLGQRLRVDEHVRNGIAEYTVHGTPADCVKFALSELRHLGPDLVISGINQGANTGVSVYYSGTISAAREALINGVPAVAVSVCSKLTKDYSASLAITRRLIEGYASHWFPKQVMLNVNVPPLPENKIAGIKITKQAASRFIEEIIRDDEGDGKKIFTLAGQIELVDPDGTSDEEAVTQGFVSITPLKLDLTDYQVMERLKQWAQKMKDREV